MASMILIDVNILVYAKRQDSPHHAEFRNWLAEALSPDSVFGISDTILSGVVRILTHPRIFREPTQLDEALQFVNQLREHPGCVFVSPGERHWDIFTRLCRAGGAKGNLVSDAFHAALAMESGAEWITADRDYARFPGLRWRHPLHPEHEG
jgi:toxin-antitoxin system PIN domain toxin